MERDYVHEGIGTFVLVLIGTGAYAVSVYMGGYDLFGVALMWGFALTIAFFLAGGIQSAHLNPALTVALAANGHFPWDRVPAYIASQLGGAFVAAATVYGVFYGIILDFEQANGITRGETGSELSAMAFHTFFPNPAFREAIGWNSDVVTYTQAFTAEVVVTALFVTLFFLLRDRTGSRPGDVRATLTLGFVFTILVAFVSPITMAALNPARDLGPRFFALLAGWGEIAFPGPRAGWWLPTFSTMTGGYLGGYLYERVIQHQMKEVEF